MSYILHAPSKLAKVLSHHPEILSLDHLDASHLPRCPVCGAAMVNNGIREVKCKEIDRIGNGATNQIEVHRIKCIDQHCWVELSYICDTYTGTNMYTSLFYRSAAEAAVIIGIDDVASRLGINVDDVKKAINCFCKESIKPTDKAILSFHPIVLRGVIFLITIDVTKRIILDVSQHKSDKSFLSKIVKCCPDDRSFIIPENEGLIEALHQHYKSNYMLEASAKASRQRNYTTRSNMIIINAAHKIVLEALIKNDGKCDVSLKESVFGYF